MSTSADDAGGSSPLDKYLILAQMDSCVESALIMNIERALRDKATFFVGELLKLPKVQALAGGPHKKQGPCSVKKPCLKK